MFGIPTDLFDFFRLGVAWVVSIYATIITLQSLWGWYVWLAGSDKYISLVRRYVIVHGLRLRFRAFWGDVVIMLLLTWACILLWVAHGRVEQLRVALDHLRQAPPPVTRAVAATPASLFLNLKQAATQASRLQTQNASALHSASALPD